jgi:hypothetical protein
VPISVGASDCSLHIFVFPSTVFTECDRVRSFLTSSGLSFQELEGGMGAGVVTKIGTVQVNGWDQAKLTDALKQTGYPATADPARINYVMAELILVILMIYVTMVYGPIAAFLVELFPTRIRYTSMSLPYHIGNGWFGGMLPLLATAMVAAKGDIYYGLWYPVIVALITVVIGALFIREPKHFDIRS